MCVGVSSSVSTNISSIIGVDIGEEGNSDGDGEKLIMGDIDSSSISTCVSIIFFLYSLLRSALFYPSVLALFVLQF